MPSRVAAAVLLFSTVLPAQPKLTDFPLTTPGAFAYDIASGPDGNLWLAEYVPGVGDKGAHDHHRERSQRSLFRRECRVDRNDGGTGRKSGVFDIPKYPDRPDDAIGNGHDVRPAQAEFLPGRDYEGPRQ
jgi:hypothetical protein